MTALDVASVDLVAETARIVALTGLAVAVSLVAALLYRWYTRERVPEGVSVLLGLSAVALVLNTEETLKLVMEGRDGLPAETTALVTVVTFVGAALGTGVGRRIGDNVAASAFAVTGTARLDREVSGLVRAVGRVVVVTLPDEIDDIDGYDPVESAVKAELAGTTFVFPRRITVADLRDRLVSRLTDDYGVGHVDVELEADGTVTYLAVGSRAAGVGPTLAPGTVAVAVQADPAAAASPGDVVQVWERTEAGLARRTTGELRATTDDDVVTLAVDATDADALDDATPYRLVTLPTEPSADREFASLLRAADETMSAVELAADSELVGRRVGDLDVTLAAIRTPDGSVTATPPRGTELQAGATLYVVERLESLRRFEGLARGEEAKPIS